MEVVGAEMANVLPVPIAPKLQENPYQPITLPEPPEVVRFNNPPAAGQ